MKKQLLISAVLTMAATASAFQWEPAIQQPNPSLDVTQAYQLETMRFAAEYGLEATDVMPKWIDEDGVEIIGSYSSFSEPSWGDYIYEFNFADFKNNGEYILQFPAGMLKNAAGELSDPKEFYYTVDIEQLAAAMFDDFEILSISPDLSQPQAIWNNQVMTVNTNHNEAIGVTTLSIIDTTTHENIVSSSNFSTNRTLGDSSPISWEVVGPYKFIEGHNYKAELVFYNGENEYSEDGVPTKVVDRAVYEFTGRVEGFKYSDITLLDVSPAPMSELINMPEQAVFTYTFSGPVTIVQAYSPLGQNGQVVYPASCLSSNEDKTVWTLDLSDDSYIKSVDAVLTICINARDLEGFQLQGEFGEEGESYFQSEWRCDIGGFPLVVVTPALGESLDRLSEIVVKAESGEAMSISWMGEACVKDMLGNVIGNLVFEEPADPDNAAATEFRFTRWFDDSLSASDINLVKEGRYTVEFGPGCFLIGDQFDSKQSRSLTSVFSITGALDEPVGPVDPADQETFNYINVDPKNEATVTSLETIKVTFPEEVVLNGCDVNVYDAEHAVVATATADFDWDNFVFDVVVLKLDKPVVDAGVYEVVIPARTITDEKFGSSDGKEGICNPEIKLVYTVNPEGSSVEAVEAVADGNVYDIHGRVVLRNASSAAVKSLPKGIYVVGGRKVVVK